MATWGTIKKLNIRTPVRPVVPMLKYPPIWADWAEDINFYLLKECCFLIFFIVSHVVTKCTFGPILVDLLELFFGPSNHCHELYIYKIEVNIYLGLIQQLNGIGNVY